MRSDMHDVVRSSLFPKHGQRGLPLHQRLPIHQCRQLLRLAHCRRQLPLPRVAKRHK